MDRIRIKPRSGALDIVHDDENFRVVTTGNPADANAFMSFTGIGGAVGGVQVEEFVGTTQLAGFFAIYITDKRRSWFNNETDTLLAVLEPLVAGKRLVSIGNSMGGFGAVWISTLLRNVETAMAFAAQVSINTDVVPNETRWSRHREKITDWRYPSLVPHFSDATRYWTFNGEIDWEHWSQFPHSGNAHHFLLLGGNHAVARQLKKHGVLSDVIQDCVEGRDPESRIKAAGVDIIRLDAANTAQLAEAARKTTAEMAEIPEDDES